MFKQGIKHGIIATLIICGVVMGATGAQAADTTPPTITSIVRSVPATATTTADTVTFRVTFSEAVQNVDVADFTLSGTAALTASITSVTASTQAVYDVVVAVPGEGTLSLIVRTAVDNIQDLAGNAYDDAVGTSEAYTVNHVPKITTITRKDPTSDTVQVGAVTFRVTFSEDVQNVDKTDFTLSGTASTGATVDSVATVDAKTYDVTTTATAEGTLVLAVKTTTDITDGTNTFGGTIDAHEDYTLIKAPTLLSSVRHDPTTATVNGGTVTFRVTFSEAVTGVDTSDFALSGTAAAKSTIKTVTAVSQTVYDVVVTVVDGTVAVAPNADASIKDADEHSYVVDTSITPETYTVGYAPLVVITAKDKVDTRAIESVSVVVTDDTAIAKENVSVDTTSTVTTQNLSCTQTTATKVACTITVGGVGDLVMRAVDSHGNASTVTENGFVISRNINIAKPKIKKVSAQKKIKLSKWKTAYVTRRNITFSGTQEALKGGTVKIYNNKKKLGEAKIATNTGAWSKSITFANGKSYKLRFKFYDKHGDLIKKKGAYKIFVDTEKPRFKKMPSKLTKRPGARVWWAAEDNHKIKRYRYTWRGKIYKTTVPAFVIARGTPRGVYTLTIRAYDKAGNKAERNVTIVVH